MSLSRFDEMIKEKFGLTREQFYALSVGERDAIMGNITGSNIEYATREQLEASTKRGWEYESAYCSFYNEVGAMIGFPLRNDDRYEKDGRVSSANMIHRIGMLLYELDPTGEKVAAFKEKFRVKTPEEKAEMIKKIKEKNKGE